MTTSISELRIFISSPGDVVAERDQARRVIAGLQRIYSNAKLVPVLWEDLALPATASFQEAIDFILHTKPIDVAVFILWSRLGSPLSQNITRVDGTPYRSGTEREFDLMLAAVAQSKSRPVILAYARDDEKSFRQRMADSPKGQLEDLIEQRKLAELFIREQFQDADGHNVRALQSYPEPVSFAQRLHTHLRQVLDEMLQANGAPQWLDDPYRGLKFFDIEHALIFHGREEETCDLLQRLRERAASGCAFAVIVGASGSGKSSLARAGVAASLVQHAYDDQVRYWRVVPFIPGLGGSELITGLTRALAEQLPELRSSGGTLEDICEGLVRDPVLTAKLAIGPAVVRAAETGDGAVKILLLVDQMEELWTDRRITTENRTKFLEVLEGLARCGHIAVLGTLRSDFYPHAQLEPAFLRLKGDRGHFDLLPPATAALQRLITEPARSAGLSFERDDRSGRTLDEMILKDASRDPAALPLLQYVLSELYQRRNSAACKLTFSAYQSLEGVDGVLGKRAAEMFGGLAQEVRVALPELLSHLVTVDIAGEQSAARRRAPLAELTATPARRALTNALIDARFLTTDRHEETPIGYLAHEALLSRWQELAVWLSANRDYLRQRTRVEQAQERWTQQNRDPSLLLAPGLPLEEGSQLLTEAPLLLSDGTVAYIRASLQHQEQMRTRTRLRRRATILTLSVLTCVAITGAVFAWFKQNEAESNSIAATAGQTEAKRQRAIAEQNSREKTELAERMQKLANANGQLAIAEGNARKSAEVAEKEALKLSVSGFHQAADSLLLTARLLRVTDDDNSKRDALDALSRAGAIQLPAIAAFQKLDLPAERLDAEMRYWEASAVALRSEATHWMSALRLRKSNVVTLASDLSSGFIAADTSGTRFAVASGFSDEILIMDNKGKTIHKLQGGRGVSQHSGKLQFSGEKTLTYVTNDPTFPISLVWTFPDPTPLRQRRVASLAQPDPSRPPGEIPYPKDEAPFAPGQSRASRASATNGTYTATAYAGDRHEANSEMSVSVHSTPDTAEREVWTGTLRGGESILKLAFGKLSRDLYVVTNQRIILIDVESGQFTESLLTEIPSNVSISDFAVLEGGAMLLARFNSYDSSRRPLDDGTKLQIWSATLPVVNTMATGSMRAGDKFALNSEGLAIVGGKDQLLRAYRGREILWKAGLPSGDGVFWQFPWSGLRGDPQRLVVQQRSLAQNKSDVAMSTSVFDPENGRLLHEFPAEGIGRALAVSDDRAFAVVADDESKSEIQWDLWSIPGAKRLGTLSRFPAGKTPRTQFSPDSRWLVVSHGSANFQLWKTAPLTRVAETTLRLHELDRITFDSQSDRMLIEGTPLVTGKLPPAADTALDFAPPLPSDNSRQNSRATVFDLSTGKSVCELDLGEGWDYERSVNFTKNIRYGAQFPSSSTFAPLRLELFDLASSKRIPLSEPTWHWIRPPQLHWSSDGTRLLVLGEVDSRIGRAELWDVTKPKLLRSHNFKEIFHGPALQAANAKSLRIVAEKSFNEKVQEINWSWVDGKDTAAPAESVLVRGTISSNSAIENSNRQQDGSWTWELHQFGTELRYSGLGPGRQAEVVLLDVTDADFRIVSASVDPTGKYCFVRGRHAGDKVKPGTPAPGGIWNTVNGRLVVRFPEGHALGCWSDNGQFALSSIRGSEDVTIWELATGKKNFTRTPASQVDADFQDRPSSRALLSNDGKRVVLLTRGELQTLDTADGKQIGRIQRIGHFTPITAVAQHFSSQRVASAGTDGGLLVWHGETGQLLKILEWPEHVPAEIEFSKNGSQLFIRSATRRIAALDLEGKVIWTLTEPAAGRGHIVMKRDPLSDTLAIGTVSGDLDLFDGGSGQLLGTIAGVNKNLSGVCFSSDGTHLALAWADGTVQIWKSASGEPMAAWNAGHSVRGMLFSAENQFLVTAGTGIDVRDLRAGSSVWNIPVSGGEISGLAANLATGEIIATRDDETVMTIPVNQISENLNAMNLGLAGFSLSPEKNESVAASDWAGFLKKYRDSVEGRWQAASELAEDHRAAERWAEAIVAYGLLIEQRPADSAAWRMRGEMHMRTGNWQKAVADLTQALGLGAAGDEVKAALTEANNKVGLSLSVEHLSDELKKDPKNSRALMSRGTNYYGLGRWKESAEDFAKATELEPGNSQAWRASGVMLALLGDPKAAAAAFQKACVVAKSDGTAEFAQLFYFHALASLEAGDQQGYVAACERLLKEFSDTKDPALANSVAWTCCLAANSTKDIGRVVELSRLAAAKPEHASLHTLATALFRSEKYQESLQTVKEGVSMHMSGGLPEDWIVLSIASAKLQKLDDANMWLKEAEAAIPMDAKYPDPNWVSNWQRRLLLREAKRAITSDEEK